MLDTQVRVDAMEEGACDFVERVLSRSAWRQMKMTSVKAARGGDEHTAA